MDRVLQTDEGSCGGYGFGIVFEMGRQVQSEKGRFRNGCDTIPFTNYDSFWKIKSQQLKLILDKLLSHV